MMTLSRLRNSLAILLLAAISGPATAQNIWTANSTTDFSWNSAANWSLAAPPLATDNVLFPFAIPNPGALANPSIIDLPSASLANAISFLNAYSLNGAGSLNLTSGGLFADFGASGNLGVQLVGSGGLTKTGYGAIILANNGNSFTGTMTLNYGSVYANTPGALGAATSVIIINGNSTRSTGAVYGGGGQLALGGGYAGLTYTRGMSIAGGGPGADGFSFASSGNNTFSGTTDFGVGGAAAQIVRIGTIIGTTTFSGAFNAAGNAQFTQLQGSGNYVLSGTVNIPTGAFLEKQGNTTQGGLNITGTITGTGEIRSTLGYIRLATGHTGAISPNGGQFELRTNSPATAFAATPVTFRGSVSGNSNASIFVDHAVGSLGQINQQVVFGTTTWANNNTTHTFTSRNGFGITFNGTHTFATGNNYSINHNTSGTVIYNGNISSAETAARTFTLFGNGDQRYNGNFLGTALGLNISKQGQGFMTIVGTAATWTGTTTISNGTLSIPKFSSLPTGALLLGNATTSVGALLYTGTAGTGAGETSGKPITFNTTTGQQFIFANQAGSAPTPLILNGTITATIAGTRNFVLGGTSTLQNEIASSIPGTAGSIINVLKLQSGTWVLSAANAYLGTTTVTGGTLVIRDTFSGVSLDVLPNASVTSFSNSNITQGAGGTLQYLGSDGFPSTESTGALTASSGEGKVVVTAGAGGTAALTFASLTAPTFGGTIDVNPDASSQAFITGTAGFVNKAIFFQNANYAFGDVGGLLRAPVYGTDAGFVDASTALTAASHNNVTLGFTEAAAINVNSLRINGGNTLTLGGALTTPAILATGGGSIITGSTVTTGGAGELTIRVAAAGDVLTLESALPATFTGDISKSGAGTLVLAGVNAYTGAFRINEGTVRLAVGSNLGANNKALVIRGGTLDLNGVNLTSPNAINALTGTGLITNTAASGTATITFGNNNASSIWLGLLNDGPTAKLAIIKAGSGDFATNQSSNFTGVLTLNGGAWTSLNIADIGVPSGFGAGDATSDATNAASLVFNGGTFRFWNNSVLFTLTNTPSVSTNRLFTLAGNGILDSAPVFGSNALANGGNNAALIFRNTAPVAFSGAGNRTLTLQGNSTGDNEVRLQLIDNPNTGLLSVTKNGVGLWHLSNSSNSYTGTTSVQLGTLQAEGTTLPANSPMLLGGGTTPGGVFQASGNFIRNLAATPTAGTGTVSWTTNTAFGGGFAASNSKLVVAIGGLATPTDLTWASGGFANAGALLLNSPTALSEVEFRNNIALNPGVASAPIIATTTGSAILTTGSTAGFVLGQPIVAAGVPANAFIVSITNAATFVISANATLTGAGVAATINPVVRRTINVDDNVSTLFDVSTITGAISGTGVGITKTGNGFLYLLGANTYTGDTALTTTSTFITSFGGTGVPTSSLGGPGGTLLLGSAANTVFVVYAGTGETSNRDIALAGTTGLTVIEASGTGPLVLSSVRRTGTGAGAGAFTFFLRGFNTDNNMLTSVIADNGGITQITKDSGGTWILTAANTHTGNTNLAGGLLGVANNSAFGTGTLNFQNASLMAFGADRTFANAIQLNNATQTVVGNFSLQFNGNANNTGGNSNFDNYLPAGKTFTFNGATLNLQDAANARTLSFRGTGTTIVNSLIQNGGTAIGTLTVNGADSFLLVVNSAANTYTGNTNLNRGTLRVGGTGEVIPHGATFGNLVFGPGAGSTAVLDLFGNTETINGLTATAAGISTITNSAAGATTLFFGANDVASTFGAALGTFNVTNTGGALTLTKIGTALATFTGAGALSYTGATNANAGILTIASPLTGTTQLNANAATLNLSGGATGGTATIISAAAAGVINISGASTFANNATISVAGASQINITAPVTLGTNTLLTVTGASAFNIGTSFTNPGNLSSVNVDGGSALSMVPAVQLAPATLNLGAGAGITTLSFGLGFNNADSSHIFATGAATTANTVRFNIFGLAGFGFSPTYDLLTATSGLDTATYAFGSTPFGYTLNFQTISPTLVRIGVVPGAANTLYWSDLGAANFSWAGVNAGNTNWFTDLAGTVNSGASPGGLTTVVLSATNATVGAPIVTTLDGIYGVDSLVFTTNPAGVNGFTINPGAPANSRIVINPLVPTTGITIDDNAGAITINSGVQALNPQTWSLTGTGNSLTIGGELSGAGNINKVGAGTISLRGLTAAYTGTVTLNAGQLTLTPVATGSGRQLPFGGSITIAGNSTLDANTGGVAALGNTVTFGAFSIASETLTVTGNTSTAGAAAASAASYNFRSTGAATISGNPTFVIGLSQTNAAGLTLAGPVTAAVATTITVVGPVGAGLVVPHAPLALTNTANSFALGSTIVVNANGVLEGKIDSATGNSSLGNLPIALTDARLRIGTNLTAAVVPGAAGFSSRYINAQQSPSTNEGFSYLQPALATQQTPIINAPSATPFTAGPGMTANPAGFQNGNDGIHFSGLLTITNAGYYGFNSRSDDGSQIFLDGTLVVNNDNGHGVDGQMPWGSTFLSAGQHTITATFGNGGAGGQGIILSYNGADTANATVFVGSVANTIFALGALPSVAILNPITVTTSARLEVNTNATVPSLTFTNAVALTVSSNGLLGATLTNLNAGGTVLQGNTSFTLLNANLTLSNAVSEAAAGLMLTKFGYGTLTVNAPSTYTGQTFIDAGGFTSNAVQATTAGLSVGSTNTTLSVASLTFNQNATFTNLFWQNQNPSTPLVAGLGNNLLTIAAGQTLTINGDATFSSNTASSRTAIDTAGGGAFVINGAAAVVRVGVNTVANAASSALVDLSGLGSFTATLGTGSLTIGAQGDNSARTSQLKLAPISSITAAVLTVGGSATGGTIVVNGTTPADIVTSMNLILGSTSNAIAVDTLNIGTGTRDMGQVRFDQANGTLNVTDAAGTGAAAFNMNSGTVGTGYNAINNFNVAGHAATLAFAATNIGTQNGRTGVTFNYFTFDTGSLTMQNLTLGSKTTATGPTTNVMTLGGGTVTITEGILNMASVSGAGANGAIASTLNITNGTVTIGNTAGVSIAMATTAASSNTATANLNISGGTVNVSGSIVRGGGPGNSQANLSLTGGTLNLNNQDIGTAVVPLSTITFSGGTMRNLGNTFQNLTQTGGTFERTTAGTSTVNGTYTVTNAIVQLTEPGALAVLTTQGLTIGNNAMLRGIGTVNGPVMVDGNGTVDPGLSPGILTFGLGASALTMNNNSRLAIEIDNATVPAAYGTGLSTFNPFLAQTINSGINITTGTFVLANGNATLLTIPLDGTGVSFQDGVQYSYKIGQVAGQDLSTLNLASPALTITTTGFTIINPDYTLTGSATGDIFLNFTPIPEPALFGVLLAGAGLFFRRRQA